ncbi:hypothetical protein JKP88DRAFT_351604 [Tribonema minus]|uniref:ApaG domain-containing protein n=1 Tax=Tribonema minus TaxID=303371 RepID=A0A835YH08_9STRA|nr:hypothetical protein JKP88DRAFT_351604 [Tribonema minus]
MTAGDASGKKKQGVSGAGGNGSRQAHTGSADLTASSSSPRELNADEPTKIPEISDPEMSLTEDERLSLWEQLCSLEPAMQRALEAEDFSTAELLRDRISLLKAQDPYFALRESFETSLARDDYYSAAKCKLQLDRLGPPAALLERVSRGYNDVEMGPSVRAAVEAAQSALAAAAAEAHHGRAPASSASSGGSSDSDGAAAAIVYSTRSEAVTHGVRVAVRAQYFPEQSDPARRQFVFVYRVRVTNESRATVQLAARRWLIRTLDAKTGRTAQQEVRGPGVVGQQPVLEPGQSFEYSSACPVVRGGGGGGGGSGGGGGGGGAALRVLGRMEGAFTMVTGAVGERGFEAKIEPFHLILPASFQQ